MKYVAIIPLVLLAFLSLALGVEYLDHEMEITISPDWSAQITEVYQVKLNQTEMEKFNTTLSSNPSIQDLIGLGSGPSFKEPVSDYHLSYVVSQSGFAQINLQYSAAILETISYMGNKEIIGIVGDTMVFQQGSKFVLPFRPTTQITIRFPESLKLYEEPEPLPTEKRVLAELPGYKQKFYEYTWKGPFSSDRFKLLFEKEKTIQSQLSLGSIWDELRYRFGNPLYLIAVVILLILVVIYRKQLAELVKEAFGEEPTEE